MYIANTNTNKTESLFNKPAEEKQNGRHNNWY